MHLVNDIGDVNSVVQALACMLFIRRSRLADSKKPNAARQVLRMPRRSHIDLKIGRIIQSADVFKVQENTVRSGRFRSGGGPDSIETGAYLLPDLAIELY